jgi:hypothetical protein
MLFGTDYWRAAYAERRAENDLAGCWRIIMMSALAEESIIGVDAICRVYLKEEPIGLLCSPEQTSSFVIDLHRMLHILGYVPRIIDDEPPAAWDDHPDFPAGVRIARRIWEVDSGASYKTGMKAMQIAQVINTINISVRNAESVAA